MDSFRTVARLYFKLRLTKLIQTIRFSLADFLVQRRPNRDLSVKSYPAFSGEKRVFQKTSGSQTDFSLFQFVLFEVTTVVSGQTMDFDAR